MPEDVAREIIQAAPTASAALQLFRTTPMSRAQRRLPALSAFPVAYWVGGDTGLKQTTKQQWQNKYLNVAEMAVLVPIPEAVFDDQDYDMWGEIRPRIVEAFGEKLDAAIFFGQNIPSEWTGVVGLQQACLAAGNLVGATDTVLPNGVQDLGVDISAAMGLVEDDGFDVTGHAGPRRLRARLRDIRATTGEAVYQTIAGGAPPEIYGAPYAIIGNGAWSNGEVLDVLGDYSQGIVGIRQDISYKIFTEGAISDDAGAVILNLMQQDSIAMRATFRVAFVVANPITRQKPTYADATRFPFATVTTDLGS
jgi:HK97 family phage major capsid protein